MKTYLVGGAVRDALMGHAGSDRDWVVVGGTPEALVAQGYQPVGRDFPVFLHPNTHEEYALARTERKTARGYHGFAVHASPDVTLEEDLARRDLTINAIAQDEHGQRTDPYGGERDIAAKVLRHVTDAFREDPVRILRLARFAARFPDFTVAAETMTLMRDMVSDGEVDALVSERVWQELSRGLMGAKPSRMLQVLRECGALQRLLPEVDKLYGVPQRAEYHPEIDTGIHLEMVLDASARMNTSLEVRFACLCHDLGKGTTPADVLPRHIGHEQRSEKLTRALCTRWRVPVECKELAELVAREHGNIHQSLGFGAEAVLRLLVRCDALRRPERFLLALQACECDARGRLGKEDEAYAQGPRLALLLKAAQSVDSATVSALALQEGLKGPAVGARLDAARLAAISAALSV
ncbi:multifunctional CCA tRNA nucleotidyl transferase/2'3'-cyclic phosphodiesterase/2'nucleotidase/phosphatase [Limnohabitans sp. Rim8]|jgi:tRNA nucleotidyltransferase (CCA-adding enzyme)|uniref:multifunctional CCA addition/repair protein n=1 Tax=Limnohabitans sp. Rim8 TaxID=1100718 RepID=UPI000D36EA5B|nr:multifunctional CCA addition/repair protein [Limnohabitans sp. Rim8]PUE56752.1 multifunctional CCA tRNA nucleotidyl transferase/2'3'-cyclic phosphodiesterase/2'nucleotidase/phosphatase [Limnohabitans sp. Rim8]